MVQAKADLDPSRYQSHGPYLRRRSGSHARAQWATCKPIRAADIPSRDFRAIGDDVTASSGWATQQLAEFLAVLTGAPDDGSAVDDGLECLAYSFSTDACALFQDGRITASRGWTEGPPGAEMMAAANSERTGISVPGVGWCETVAIAVDRDIGTTLLLARAGQRFTAEEVGLLRGMAQVLGLTLRWRGTVAIERRHLEENRRQLEENTALVATLQERQTLLERLAQIQRRISSREPLDNVLDAITAGAAELLGDEMVGLRLIDELDPSFMIMASAVDISRQLDDEYGRVAIGTGVGGRAIVEDRLCVAENYPDTDGRLAGFAADGIHAAMAAPIHIEGRTVGSLAVASRRKGRTYSQPERDILVGFAEHASLALNDDRAVQAMNKALGRRHAPGHARRPDRTAQPGLLLRPDRSGPAPGHPRRHQHRGPALRPGPFQRDQRYPRPQVWRPGVM